MTFTPIEAAQIIESLRYGTPPDGFVRHFTVGCENEIAILKEQLENQNVTALLVNAKSGSGKTHLLKFIREEAFEQNYAVSLVTLDARNGTPFNKIDLIFDTICRNIEIPPNVEENDTSKGIRSFFNLVEGKLPKLKKKNDLEGIFGIVGFNDFGLPIFSNDFNIRSSISAVEEFLSRKALGKKNYDKSWWLLRVLNNLARFAGLKGLVILFDEFEDILTNITRIEDQKQCFVNLSQFCNGTSGVKTFYAVTPEFANKWPEFIHKCVARFAMKNEDYFFKACALNISNNLRSFKMSPLEKPSLVEIGKKIVRTHGIAYNWDTSKYATDEIVSRWLDKSASIKIENRTIRQSVTLIVSRLDKCYDDYNELK